MLKGALTLRKVFPPPAGFGGSFQNEMPGCCDWEIAVEEAEVWIIKTPYKGNTQGGITGAGTGEGFGRAGTLGTNWRPFGAKRFKWSPRFSHGCYIPGKEGYYTIT